MAYPLHIIERAKTMFIQQGMTCESIAKVLQTDGYKITGVTVKAWSRKKNNFGETWEDILNRKMQIDERRLLKEQTTKRKQIFNQVAEIHDAAFRSIQKEIEKGKTKFGLRDFELIAKFMLQLEDQEKQSWNPDGVAEQLLKILYSDPQIKKVLDKRMPLLLPKIYEVLGKANMEKPVNE
jgi:hypothetical protein